MGEGAQSPGMEKRVSGKTFLIIRVRRDRSCTKEEERADNSPLEKGEKLLCARKDKEARSHIRKRGL